jgi:hypothetical protein
MARANAPELVALREAWRQASPEIRGRFLAETASVVPKDSLQNGVAGHG